jgi:multiple sugar transport system substrate-binding protein
VQSGLLNRLASLIGSATVNQPYGNQNTLGISVLEVVMGEGTVRRLAVLAAIAVLGLLAATGCSGGGASGSGGGGKQVRVLMEDISYTDNIKSMLPEFEKQTGIKITIETVPYSDMSAKILQNFAQQSPYYDAVFTDNVFGSGYFASGYVVDLKSLAAKDTQYGTLNAFYQPYVKPMTSSEGAVFGLPVYGESTFLMYRKDLFQKYGITQVPQTTEQLETAAKKISEATNGQIAGITMRGAPGIQSVYPWAGLLRSFGGDFFDASGKIAVNSPEAVKATEFWAGLLRNYGPKGAANFDWEQNRIAFTQGKAAMTIDATANGPFNENPKSSTVAGKVGYAPVPYAAGTTPDAADSDNSLNVHALYLSKFSKNPDSTYKFMSWATGDAVQSNAVKTVESVGVTLDKVLKGQAYAAKYGTFQKAVLAQVSTGNVNYLPSGKDSNKIIVETGQALSSVLSGQSDAKAALDAAAKNLDGVKAG